MRICGTCRYFRDCGVAGSGWCTHPERGDRDDLVLVRRADLACRDATGRSRWAGVDADAPRSVPRLPRGVAVIHERYGVVD